MNDRYEIIFKEGGVDTLETIITGGLAKITEKALDTITSDDSHGWYCQIIDTETNLKVRYWGVTKVEAQEKAFKELKRKIEDFKYEQEKEYERQQINEQEKRQSYSHSNSASSDTDGISAIFYLVGIAIAIAIALFILLIAILLSPLGLLIWYLIDKRKSHWIAIVGMLIATYLIYDISSGGFITENMMHMQKDGSEKYLTLGYFIILVTTLGFFIDKYSSTNIPVAENGNFFTQKDVIKRRPLIAGLSVLLLSIFSIFTFVGFPSNKSNNQNQQTTQRPNTNNNTVDAKTEVADSKNSKMTQADLKNTFNGFMQDWNNKNYEGQVNVMSEDFYYKDQNSSKNRNDYLKSKKRLFNKYSWIKIESSDVKYTINNNKGVVSYYQHYDSPTYESWGLNKFYFKLVEGKIKIYKEEFKRDRKNIKTNKTSSLNQTLGRYPQASQRILSKSEVASLNKSDLKIMRNEIFARYGHSFKKGGKMEAYFNRQKWYKNENIDATMLISDIEKKNIKLIQKYE